MRLRYRNLGRTGLKVSELCLGTMTFGRWIDEGASQRVLDAALDGGLNFIDTADVYGRGQDNQRLEELGQSEEILGRILGSRRHQVVLATKGWFRMGPDPNAAGLSRVHLIRAVDDSLRRLKTDYIDLYQVHNPDPETPVEETLQTLDLLVRQGKIRYIGVSNHFAWQVAKARGICLARGLEPYISAQTQYSILVRSPEQELLPFCQSEGVGVMVYSPMARGLLADKYAKGEPFPAGTRAAAGEPMLHKLMQERNYRIVERLRPLAAARGKSMAQFAVAWVLSHPAVTSAIIGASRPEQVQENLGATGWTLTEAERQTVEEICASA